MTIYEYIKKQSIEQMCETITDFVALHIMQVAFFGMPTDVDFFRKEVMKNLTSEDVVTDESKGWRVHPQGFGQYCVDMVKAKMDGELDKTESEETK